MKENNPMKNPEINAKVNKNPDFINKNKDKIIEAFGSYWHTKKARVYEETEAGRIEYFKKYGFDTLIIWENELKNLDKVLEKIKNFDENNRFI